MAKSIDETDLANLIGPAHAAEFARRAKAAEEKFSLLVAEASAKIIEETRDDFMQFVSNPELAEHKSMLIDTMRLSVLDGVSCIMLNYGAEVAAELRTSYADFAHHLLSHLEAAYKHKAVRDIKSSYTTILNELVPPEVLERLKKEAKEGPEG